MQNKISYSTQQFNAIILSWDDYHRLKKIFKDNPRFEFDSSEKKDDKFEVISSLLYILVPPIMIHKLWAHNKYKNKRDSFFKILKEDIINSKDYYHYKNLQEFHFPGIRENTKNQNIREYIYFMNLTSKAQINGYNSLTQEEIDYILRCPF